MDFSEAIEIGDKVITLTQSTLTLIAVTGLFCGMLVSDGFHCLIKLIIKLFRRKNNNE